MRYAKILDSKVENVIALLDENLHLMPNDWILVKTDTANIGDDYINGVFIAQPLAYIEPIVVSVISMRQARLQLNAMNLLNAVNAQISTMPQSAQIEWDWASEVRRDNPLVAQLQSGLAMTDDDMNQFFSSASLL